MLGFGADAWLNNTAFQAKSIAEFLKIRNGPAIFFLRRCGGKSYSRSRYWAKTLFQSLPVEEFSTVIPGKEINP
jgi:hypothetical protein